MTTQDSTPMQHLMRDLQQRQQGLGEQLQAFETLQQEIAQLQRRAPNDAQARRRLSRLSCAMQSEFAPLNQRLQHFAQSLHTQLESLEVSLCGAGNPATRPSGAVSKRKASLLGRAFF